ncbi:hypothetical protein E0K89_003440 [Aquicoccus sp. SCR17]|nr:hypothetical protein [Carideicomes alvinocaridis]
MPARHLPTLRLARARLREFLRDSRASITVESAILLPILSICFVLMYVIFDAFRQQAVSQKASYTISDMLSRETDYINPTYMDHAREMLEWLSSQHRQDIALRVTVISYDADQDRYAVEWSKTRGDSQPWHSSDVRDWHDQLPVMVDNEQVILVETWSQYEPPLNVGFLPREIRTRVFTRPRFTGQLKWRGNGV